MRADARRSRAKLLDAATEAFAETGADARLEDIARRVGVGIGTLYRHFLTRLDLQAAVYRSQVEAVCAAVDEHLGASTPDQALAGWLRALAAYLSTVQPRAFPSACRSHRQGLRPHQRLHGRDARRHPAADDRRSAGRHAARRHQAGRCGCAWYYGVVIATEQVLGETDRLLGLDPRRGTGPGLPDSDARA